MYETSASAAANLKRHAISRSLTGRRRLFAAFSVLTLAMTVLVTMGPVGSVVDNAAAAPSAVCETGNLYAISGGGQIQHVNASPPAANNVGSAPSGGLAGSSWNGLGVDFSGRYAYAYNRPGSTTGLASHEVVEVTG